MALTATARPTFAVETSLMLRDGDAVAIVTDAGTLGFFVVDVDMFATIAMSVLLARQS
jgi:hypothetical protein